MAIQTEFIDFIVNISAIRAKYPGGWEQCLEDHANLIGGRVSVPSQFGELNKSKAFQVPSFFVGAF